MRTGLLALALALSLAPAHAHAAERGFVVVGATLIDGTGAPAVPDSVVVVEGDRIKAAGPRAMVSIPKGLPVVEGRGRWLMPGLIDAHVHFFQSADVYTRPDAIDLRKHRSYEKELAWIREHLPNTFARYLACGITGVADVGGPFWNFVVREHAAATPMAPRVVVAGPLLSTVSREQLDVGDPPIIKVASPEEARALVRRELAKRPDLIKVWFIVQGPADIATGKAIVQAAVAEAGAQRVRVAVHATELEAARASVEAGATVLVHSVWDKPVDDAFVSLLKEHKVLYTPTLVVPSGYSLVLTGRFTPTPAETRLGDPEVMTTFEELKRMPELQKVDPARVKRGEERERIGSENLKRVADAGVMIAAGTDAGNIGTLHGPSLYRELQAMVDAGMTRAQVLSAATLGGARVMGQEREIGTIAAGKHADLLILDADPTADLATLEKPREIVKDGHRYTQDELLKAANGKPAAR
jgi:imidazolonepropionase-like amidohydrolase